MTQKFRGVGLNGSDRTHSTENHRSIQERIDPIKICEEMVAENTDPKPKD